VYVFDKSKLPENIIYTADVTSMSLWFFSVYS